MLFARSPSNFPIVRPLSIQSLALFSNVPADRYLSADDDADRDNSAS
jgi:hypothetical protein